MKTLAIDIETYSSVNLQKSGVYAYCEAPDFCILLFAYAFDEEKVRVVDFAQGELLPEEVLKALTSSHIIKTAYNANFERTCLARFLGQEMPPEQWQCTAALADSIGLPNSLMEVSKALGLSLEEAKDKTGKALIQYFSVPCKTLDKGEIKAGSSALHGLEGQRIDKRGLRRNRPEQNPKKWELFKAYCKQDVVAERAIRKRLNAFQMPAFEQMLWQLDQKINDRGVLVDLKLVENIIAYDSAYKRELLQEAKALTQLNNPNSLPQLKEWLKEQGIRPSSLDKTQLEELMETATGKVKRVLEIRRALSKTSTKKYETMQKAVCKDGRLRGCFKFYGSRTGRWSGKLVQLHNLPQNKIKDIGLARELAVQNEFEKLDLLFGEAPFVFSQLIRTAFTAEEGRQFIISDFSAIEARVIAWLADEKWRQEVFASHGKIYEASASRMFHVPMESIEKGSPLRQKGKVAELACGYGGGIGALKAMGAEEMGLEEIELKMLIEDWRQSNPHIVRLWKTCEQAARDAINTGWPQEIGKGVSFSYEKGNLFVSLPSGRRLAYFGAEQEGKTITYMGMAQQTKKWSRIKTYGGKLVENIVQAIARDCLGETMLNLEEAGYEIVCHVHDEVILEVPWSRETEITYSAPRMYDKELYEERRKTREESKQEAEGKLRESGEDKAQMGFREELKQEARSTEKSKYREIISLTEQHEMDCVSQIMSQPIS